MIDVGQYVVSIVSGGLAGGSVSSIANRRQYIRSLRTRFYPKVNNAMAAYMLRLEDPVKRMLIQNPGYMPALGDREFVNERSEFIHCLVEFNELPEAREVRKKLMDNMTASADDCGGSQTITDLTPEYQAIQHCHDLLHKKLKLG